MQNNTKKRTIYVTFLIDKLNSDKRFILNLKLNESIIGPRIKMGNMKLALKLFRSYRYMATIELEDTYFLVLVVQK